jgi:hypothetical protein
VAPPSINPEKQTARRARRALRKGKAPTTAAGEFVREEIEHVRRGKHGARSTKQAIAIGLSKARRAGVPLEPPRSGPAKRKAERDLDRSKHPRKPSARRGRAVKHALQREPKQAASRRALSTHARRTARRRKR